MTRPAWYPDERAHAGPEHLDPAYVATYEAKSGLAPGDELALLRAHGLGPETTLVDLGAGTGLLALAAAPHCRRVVAVDPSPAMLAVLARARRRRRSRERRGRRRRPARLRAPGRPAAARPLAERPPPPARLLEGDRAAPRAGAPRARRHAPPARPRLPVRAGRGGGADRDAGSPARPPRRRRAGRVPSSRSTSAPSTAPTRGCSSRCSSAQASRSASSGVRRGIYATYVCVAP